MVLLKTYNLRQALYNINYRCTNSNDRKFKYYGGKGIKNYLTFIDLKFLWERDKGHLLKYPSIDRRDGAKDYTIKNCRFIEMAVNRRRTSGHFTGKCNPETCLICIELRAQGINP